MPWECQKKTIVRRRRSQVPLGLVLVSLLLVAGCGEGDGERTSDPRRGAIDSGADPMAVVVADDEGDGDGGSRPEIEGQAGQQGGLLDVVRATFRSSVDGVIENSPECLDLLSRTDPEDSSRRMLASLVEDGVGVVVSVRRDESVWFRSMAPSARWDL